VAQNGLSFFKPLSKLSLHKLSLNESFSKRFNYLLEEDEFPPYLLLLCIFMTLFNGSNLCSQAISIIAGDVL
jgi:hypothetical protein